MVKCFVQGMTDVCCVTISFINSKVLKDLYETYMKRKTNEKHNTALQNKVKTFVKEKNALYGPAEINKLRV